MDIKKLRLSEIDFEDLKFCINHLRKLNSLNMLNDRAVALLSVSEAIDILNTYNNNLIISLSKGKDRDLLGVSSFYMHKTIEYILREVKSKTSKR